MYKVDLNKTYMYVLYIVELYTSPSNVFPWMVNLMSNVVLSSIQSIPTVCEEWQTLIKDCSTSDLKKDLTLRKKVYILYTIHVVSTMHYYMQCSVPK